MHSDFEGKQLGYLLLLWTFKDDSFTVTDAEINGEYDWFINAKDSIDNLIGQRVITCGCISGWSLDLLIKMRTARICQLFASCFCVTRDADFNQWEWRRLASCAWLMYFGSVSCVPKTWINSTKKVCFFSIWKTKLIRAFMNGNKTLRLGLYRRFNDRFLAWSRAVRISPSARSLSPVTTPKTGR